MRFDPRTVFHRRNNSHRFAAAVLAHDRTGAKELLAADFIEGCRCMLQHMKLVEDDLGARQRRADGVQIRPIHIRADRVDHGVLPRGQILGEQCRRGGFGPVLAQTDHLTMHDIRQDGPEPLAFAALNFIEPDVPRLAFDARAIPLGEKCVLGATRLPPAHAVPDGRVTGRH